MGQAAVDLPDPLESPPVSPASTDDLLAQLAGEEIERLLAEADGPAPRPSVAAPVGLPGVAAPSGESKPAQVDSLLEPPAAAAASQASANDLPTNDLNALFTRLSSSPDPASTATDDGAIAAFAEEDSPTVPVINDSESSAAEALAREILEDESLTASARAGLSMASNSPTTGASKTQADQRGREDPIPLALRLLNGISAPLDCFSDRTRELVGKIAILTTINALAVLGYVLFFRHR